MSRIGKNPIPFAKEIKVSVAPDNTVTVKGPKGELTQALDRDMKVEINEDNIVIKRPTDQIRHRALHGLTRSLVNNMVIGVTEGYSKTLELVGVGYRASSQGNILDLSLGYSHNIVLEVPKEISVS